MITSWQFFSLGNFPQFATTHFPLLRFNGSRSIALPMVAPFCLLDFTYQLVGYLSTSR